MIVVSDTSPINYRVQIGEVEVLPRLFERVLVPRAVYLELEHERAPEVVRDWLLTRPAWLEIHPVSDQHEEPGVDRCEAEAIALAIEVGAPALIDDRRGRAFAESKGVRVIGTIGIIEEAARRDLLDFGDTIRSLALTNFHLSQKLLGSLMRGAERDNEVHYLDRDP